MRKVEVKVEENNKYEIIKKLVETNGNKNTAKERLGCSLRTINRMINGYKREGKEYFVHGNKGKMPVHTISSETKQLIIDLYKNKYYESTYAHYAELLFEYEKIVISESVVRKTLMTENILSPRTTKKTKKNLKKLLLEQQDKLNLSEKDRKKIIETIIAIEDSHPRRPRCAYWGELIQMDASVHNWFGNSKTHLHIAVDDATGNIVGAYFDKEETLKGYYNILHQILSNYGIPYKFLTDNRTVFEYKKKNSPKIEDDTFTQFGYACHQLGIELETTSIPQAKGRVERLFETLQLRLPIEMRLAGITEIEQANEFLKSYVKKFNAKFALPINNIKSVFEKQPSNSEINLMLAVLTNRKIDSGHCIRFNNKYYKTVDENNSDVYHRKSTDALIIKAFDGQLFASINDKVYGLDEVPLRETYSKNFDILKETPKEKTIHIPGMSHPWKQASFNKYLKKQAHLKNIVAS